MNYNNLNIKLKNMTEKAINIALDSLENGNQLYPFVVFGIDGKSLQRFIVESADDAYNLAEGFIEEIDEESPIAILTYYDKLKFKDGEYDAIIIQAYDEDEEDGYSFGQLYENTDNKIRILNKKYFLGKIRNILIF